MSDWVRSAPLDAGLGRNVLLLKLGLADKSHAEPLLEQVRARRAEAEQLHVELVELDAAGGEGDPPFEYLTRRWGFFYVDTLGRWLEEVEQELTELAGDEHFVARTDVASS